MTDATNQAPNQDPESGEGGERNRSRTMMFLVAFIAIVVAAMFLLQQESGQIEIVEETGSFEFSFEGCDESGACADFMLYAPGYDYRWTYGRAAFDPVNGAPPNAAMLPIVRTYLAEAEGAIASGLASREGDSIMNRQLSACRSKRLADLLVNVAGSTDNIYRVSMGRYVDDAVARDDTSIERLVVMAFIMRTDFGVDLSEALKDGLSRDLPPALEQLLPEVARQIDFKKYECWTDEFEVSPTGQPRTACYAEQTAQFLPNCVGFQ